jgi:hypothetical protein
MTEHVVVANFYSDRSWVNVFVETFAVGSASSLMSRAGERKCLIKFCKRPEFAHPFLLIVDS